MSDVVSFRAKPKIKEEIVAAAKVNNISIGEYLISLHTMKESGRDLRDSEQPKLKDFANKTAEFYIRKMGQVFDYYFEKMNAQQQQFIEIYEEQVSLIKDITDRSILSNKKIKADMDSLQKIVEKSDDERRKQINSHTRHLQKKLEVVEEELESVSVKTKAIVEVMKPKVSSPLWKRLFG